MAVRVADTIKPMGSGTFPVAEAADVSIVVQTTPSVVTKRLQDMFDDKELGGLPTPSAANKMLVSKSDGSDLEWTEVDADNDELGNSAGYQTSSDVSTAIGNALTADFGSNHATGQIVLNSSNAGSVQVGPAASGVAITGNSSTSNITVGGSTASSNVTITSSDIKIHNVSVATSSDVSTAIGNALTADFGVNHSSGEITLNSTSNTGLVQVGPSAGVTITGNASTSSITVGGSTASSNVTITSSGIKIHDVSVATMSDIQGITWTVTVVSSLPASGEEHVLYLVPDASGTAPDAHEEYIWTVLDSTTNPATYGYEKIGDTNISLSAESITYANAGQSGVTNVKGSLDDLVTKYSAIDSAVPLTISSYTVSPATLEYEKGTTLAANDLTFAWTVNKTLTSQTFDGTSITSTLRTTKNSTAVSATKTFTLSCTAGSQTDSKSITISFLDSVYWGSAAAGTYNSSFIRGLSNSALKSSYSGSYAMTVATNQYGFIAFPATMSPPSACYINGFYTEMILIDTISVTNASSATADYKLYRTNQQSLGSLSLEY